eukprot:TRINITY_DN12469_c1_g1_i2.p3 TRINITY_DN12469_c1_g1~~TRINITY_DN12469_c1_g1_i2.p3  ORF type:complete len:226 (+),score=29.16 TRINITY_DN12469_c1_g1_i2:87-764(+)
MTGRLVINVVFFKKVSIDGFRMFRMQNQALAAQSEVAFEQWERAGEDEQAKQTSLERLKSRNEEMTTRLPQDSPLLVIARARIAYAEDDTVEAGRLLRDFESRVGNNHPEANWMLGQLAIRANNLTEAGRRVDVYLADNSGEVRAMLVRADIHSRLREWDDSLAILDRLNAGLPGNAQIEEMIRKVKIAMGELEADDPVQAAINESANTSRTERRDKKIKKQKSK